ncbi:unnamed protein product [Sphagnum balticum]
MQLVDESKIVVDSPKAIIIQNNNDNTTTVTTNNIDYTSLNIKNLVTTLQQQANIDIATTPISTIQQTIGNQSTEYTVVLSDLADNTPIKQVTIVQNTNSQQSIVTDVQNLETQVKITALQNPEDNSVSVINVQPVTDTTGSTSGETPSVTTSSIVNDYGVETTYTNDPSAISDNKKVQIALASITADQPQLKDYQVFSKTSNGTQQVVSVNSQATQTVANQTVTVTVDNDGNTVTQATGESAVQDNQPTQTVLPTILSQQPSLSNWTPSSVQTVDYGSVTQVTVVFQGPQPTDSPVQVVSYLNEDTQNVTVATVNTLPTTAADTPSDVALPVIPTTLIPAAAVPDAQTNPSFNIVLASVQQGSPDYTGVVPTTTQVQDLGSGITQYTMIFDVKGRKDQVVTLYNGSSSTPTPVTLSTVATDTIPYFVTESVTAAGTTISSNNVEKIAEKFATFTAVLNFTGDSFPSISVSDIQNVTAVPQSPQIITYTIVSGNYTASNSVTLNYDSSTSTATILNYQ